MKKIASILGLCFWFANIASAQTFEAKVNRADIPEGETFLLSVELKNAQADGTPDFSVLNQDFTTYSVSNSYRTNIINGNVSQSKQWNLVLMPNKTGKIIIPAISLDDYKTQPLTINVGGQSQTSGAQTQGQIQQPRFKIEADIDNHRPYVQQQLNYTVTIYDTGGLQGEEPTFELQNQDDWIIKSLGGPVINSKTINGITYREIKFSYAMFAQKSGEQTLPEAKFNGFYLTKEQRNDPFQHLFGDDDFFISGFGMRDVFATRNPVILRTKPISIRVLPAAEENGSNWWLPAEDVKLYSEFNTQSPKFNVGEAVSRNIYLQATGVIDSQLPEIKFTEVNGVKQYPEKPLIEMKVEKDKIVATEKITNVYIPNEPGEITLPAVNVQWFNVKTKKIEIASLPPMTVKVGGDAISQPIQQVQPKEKVEQLQETKIIENITPKQEINISLLLGGAFLFGIIICLLLLKLWTWIAKPSTNYKKQVIKAAKAKDVRKVRDGLLAWAAAQWPNQKILSLHDIDEIVDDKEFRCELDKLTEALYAENIQDWNEFLFMRVFNKINKRKKGLGKYEEPLPKLYK